MRSFKIAIIGTGNVAWHLARAFENTGHIITDIYGRKKTAAKDLALGFYNARFTNSPDLSESPAEIFILAVADDAIEAVAHRLLLPPEAVLAHTSGTRNIRVLGYAPTENIGVFYPLQTLTRGKSVRFRDVPIAIEGETSHARERLTALAGSISDRVYPIDSARRNLIHLAAVFACNFSNHMLTLSQQILKAHDIDFALLHPLISETLHKSLEVGPENAQTGPARRGDLETLDQQFEALRDDEETAEIYRLISQHIINYYEE